MLKTVETKIREINYSGNSLGDDIRVEAEVLGRISFIDKRMKVGTTVEINHEIGRFETEQKLFKVDIRLTAIEKDILFNDVGSVEGVLKIDTQTTSPQRAIFEVQIRETRSISGKSWGKATAVFKITVEAKVSDTIRYIPDEGDGWLQGKFVEKKLHIDLPAFLKIKPEYIQQGREYFTLLEGTYRGKRASIILKKDGSSQFISGVEHRPMARVVYSITQKVLTVGTKKYQTVDDKKAPWKKGLYDIEIPDYSHGGGRNYLKKSKRAMTWFRIGHEGERYLHTGRHSLGCITVVEIIRWEEIYEVLIKARKGDFMSVGVLEVID